MEEIHYSLTPASSYLLGEGLIWFGLSYVIKGPPSDSRTWF